MENLFWLSLDSGTSTSIRTAGWYLLQKLGVVNSHTLESEVRRELDQAEQIVKNELEKGRSDDLFQRCINRYIQ